MDGKIYQLIEGYRDEFTETLRRWIRVPSVKGEAAENAPFGREVRNMLAKAYEEAKQMLSENRPILDKIAAYLIERETITGEEFLKIFREYKDSVIQLPDTDAAVNAEHGATDTYEQSSLS